MLLLDRQALEARREIVAGPLAPLVASLRKDLDPLLAGEIEVPAEKAMLSRDGGRCPRDGAQLAFDPYEPEHHRCPVCGAALRGERHHLWWIMSRHLWLAERALHAAALWAVTGEAGLARLASAILERYAERYEQYPNRDNVLGPSGPFFSTYLESIWVLQLALSLDLLETGEAAGVASRTVRRDLIAPSLDRLSSYVEGDS
jgi:hypothetical protein